MNSKDLIELRSKEICYNCHTHGLYDLFKGIAYRSDCVALTDSMINKLEGMWKESVIA
jgi:hypothetical protein